MEIWEWYLLLINIFTFSLFMVDKRRAMRGKWRIRERGLILASLAGGSAGGLAAMYLYRHKTRHRKFTLGLPLILSGQIILLILLLGRYR